MAIARIGPLIGGISGSLGSSTFRNTRSGLVIAAHGRKNNQQSPLQKRNKALLQTYLQLWLIQSDATKAHWKNRAAAVKWPNRIGVSRSPTAKNFFISCNMSFWDPTYPLESTSPNEDAELGQPLLDHLDYTQTPAPSAWSIDLSLSRGLHITSTGPASPDADLFEFLWISFDLRYTISAQPKTWTKLGRQEKFSDTLDWTPWLNRPLYVPTPGIPVAFRLRWQHIFGPPSIPVWQITQLAA
jgi:hypothetical protein